MNAPGNAAVSLEETWRAVLTAALLGTDRRDPRQLGELLPADVADLVADATPRSPSERLLITVAALTALRRAGALPSPAATPPPPPTADRRPVCPHVAVERWRHIVDVWPLLEEEWLVVLLREGWRAAPELVPSLLVRHRDDPVRRQRAERAAGPLADWLVELCPELAARPGMSRSSLDDVEHLAPLPVLPDLDLGDVATAQVIAAGLTSGRFAAPHRASLVNAVARVDPSVLPGLVDALGAVAPAAPGHAIAASLLDLGITRERMLAELCAPTSA